MEGDEPMIHEECRADFKYIREPRCFKCGRTIDDEEKDICRECRQKDHIYSYGLPLFEYNETAQRAMIDYKKNGWKRNGDFFSEEFVKRLGRTLMGFAPEVLIPVPVSRSKLRKRGFNQSEYLAERIAEALELPVDPGILRRKGNTEQKELSKEQRAENALHSFECVRKPEYKRVCLVDDVYTTGSTLEGCSRELAKNGVKEIGFLTVFSGEMLN
jgi:ComF family protein